MKMNLFTPMNIGSLTIKNRLVTPAMISNYCDPDGSITERFKAFYARKAEGGYGMLIVESFAISQQGYAFPMGPRIDDDKFIPDLKDLTDRIHGYNAVCFLQLSHSGAQMSSKVSGMPIVSASRVPASAAAEIPRELTREEIKELISTHGDCALRAKKAGFDGVEVHVAHGYLLNEFVSPYANKRTDEYGGTLVNRLRIVKEIIADIRGKCGSNYPITVRINLLEGVDGGHSLADIRAMALLLEEYGASALNLSTGNHRFLRTIVSNHHPHGWLAEYAASIKKVVNIPVIVAGRITDPVVAEGIIASGQADFVITGRAALADPDFPKKAQCGDFEGIRPCVGCMEGCYDNLRAGPICCLVNPTLGYEYLHELKPAEVKKHVMVVGGGPAGLQAAIAAAQIGHKVDLFEKQNMLGGNYAVAAYPPAKGEITGYISWARNELNRLGVAVHLGAEATLETVKSVAPDTLIVTSGSRPSVPNIPGIHGENVKYAETVLTGGCTTGMKVVVAGGGMVGLETAMYLAEFGRDVTVLEYMSVLAPDMGATRPDVMGVLNRYGVKLYTEAKITSFSDKGVTAEVNGSEQFFPCDTAVLALGYTPERSLADAAKDVVDKVIVAGDAVEARRALEAGREGFLAGINA